MTRGWGRVLSWGGVDILGEVDVWEGSVGMMEREDVGVTSQRARGEGPPGGDVEGGMRLWWGAALSGGGGGSGGG